MGWIALVLIAALAVGALWLLKLRGALLQLGAAAIFLGAAGYALQGSPGTPGSPRTSAQAAPPVRLTNIRHDFFGQFTGAESWLRISEALASRGRTADAVGALTAAVREHPGDPQLWVGLGNALVDHAGMITPASQFAYRHAAEIAPGHPAPTFFYGLALARSGEREAAIALWKETLARAPADASWRPRVEDALAALDGTATP
ncbi:tetratricopeptide repeat protein [Sphingomonas sabuli]|nr:tetratricopeptide repeat protein [Sphingomonas sabuli]